MLIEPEPETPVHRPPTRRPPTTNYPDERACSPVSFDEEIFHIEERSETAELVPVEVDGGWFEKATVLVEDDVCFVEEENFVLEATLDLQQLTRLTITITITVIIYLLLIFL